MKRSLVALVAVVALAVAACGDDDDGGGGGDDGAPRALPSASSIPAGSPTVEVKNIKFEPEDVTIDAGQAVVWNFDDGSIPHDVKGTGVYSGTKTKTTWAHVFEEPGTFRYICSIHPQMKGTVTVQDG